MLAGVKWQQSCARGIDVGQSPSSAGVNLIAHQTAKAVAKRNSL